MYRIDHAFLAECGLGYVLEPLRSHLLVVVYDELTHRVGTQLSDGLNSDQRTELAQIVEHDRATVVGWVEQNQPAFLEDERLQKIVRDAAPGTPRLTLLGEYAAQAWLALHRPDYPDVVMRHLDGLRHELRRNPDPFFARAALVEPGSVYQVST